MMLKNSLSALIAAATLAVAPVGASAQEQPAEVVRETHGSWEIRCVGEACAMTQTFADSEGRPVLAVSISKLPEAQTTDEGVVILGIARILTPLNVQLPEGLGLKIDDGPARSAPYVVCSQVGCLSRPPLTADLVEELKGGSKAEFLTVIETPEGKRIVAAPIALEGFTAAFEAL